MLQSLIATSPLMSTPFDLRNIPGRQVMLLFLCNRWGSRDSVCEQCTQVGLKPTLPGWKLSSFHYFALTGMIWMQQIFSDVNVNPQAPSERQACNLHGCSFNSDSDSEQLTSGNVWKWTVEIAFNVAPMNQQLLLIWTVGKSLLIRHQKSGCRKALRVNRDLSTFTEGFRLLIWPDELWAEWRQMPLPKWEPCSKNECGVWLLC